MAYKPDPDKTIRLTDYLIGLYSGEVNRAHYDQYASDLESAGPDEVNSAIDNLIKKHDDFYRIETAVAKFIRAAGKSLDSNHTGKGRAAAESHFIGILIKENAAINRRP